MADADGRPDGGKYCAMAASLGVEIRHFTKGVKFRLLPFVKIRPKWGHDYPPTKGSFGKKGRFLAGRGALVFHPKSEVASILDPEWRHLESDQNENFGWIRTAREVLLRMASSILLWGGVFAENEGRQVERPISYLT